SKPFLEHLEDLRWTVVKMAIALLLAMMACFAFRSMLVRVMQAPLHALDPQVGALKALGITDSFVISFHLAFYAGIVVSFPLLLYFIAQFVLPALTAIEKRFLFPAILGSFGLFLLHAFRRARFRDWRGHRLVSERRHLSVAPRHLDQRTEPFVLSELQNANSVAAKYSNSELALLAWSLREVWRQDCVSLFRR